MFWDRLSVYSAYAYSKSLTLLYHLPSSKAFNLSISRDSSHDKYSKLRSKYLKTIAGKIVKIRGASAESGFPNRDTLLWAVVRCKGPLASEYAVHIHYLSPNSSELRLEITGFGFCEVLVNFCCEL